MQQSVSLNSQQGGEGPEVCVLLHGLFGNRNNLAALGKTLESRFRVIRPDLRNHGVSPHADEMDLDLMAADVRRLLDAENIDQVVLLGHSLGGKVAMTFALRWPGRCRALAVLDISPEASGSRHDAVFEGLRAIDLRALKSREAADRELAGHVSDAGVRAFLLSNLTRNDEGGWCWRMHLDAIEANYAAITDAVCEGLYPGPVLFVRGENSDYIQSGDRHGILRRFPGSELRIIQGAGHWLHAEKPAAVSHALSRFLEKLPSTSV